MFGRKKEPKKTPKKPVKKDKLSSAEITEKIEEGALRVMVTFEVVGKPQSFVEASLKDYVANVRKDSRLHVLDENTQEAVETEDGLFSTFSEVEMVVDDLSVLVWIAVNFSPASIEIMEPAEKMLTAGNLTSWLNDLLSKLHEVSSILRDTTQKNVKMNESLNALLKNIILMALETGNYTAKELQQKTGVFAEQLKPFLDHLVEKKKIVCVDETYSLKK